MDASGLGRSLMALGAILLLVGALVAFVPRLPWLGRLPGDFVFGGQNWKVLPLGTSLLLSIVLSLLLRFLFRK